ncbi:MAG: DNA methyltransferase, partial [candidate division WOR-3 bacterium]|nr:DNA methyltransferase [candidate division WOR-3 bacterium]
RLIEMHRLLRPTGSIYVHLDWHAVHYMKCEMDDIFGMDNFRNEIIWCYRGAGYPKKDFGRRHDTILRYSKSKDYVFNLDDVREEYAEATKERFKHYIGNVRNGKDFGLQKLHPLGKQPDDWWQIQPIAPSAKARLGYPTQKPEALMERIIKASSNEGDVVADFFCGGGTALAAAERLGRRWIGCDVSPIACKLMRRRVAKLIKEERDIEIIGMPHGLDELKAMDPFEFQNHVIVDLLHGTCSRTKSADYGIDGHDFGHNPVQIKQSEHVGRPVVQKFESAVRREKRTKGIIVAFSFSKTAYEEAARIKLDEDIEIELRKVQELLADYYRRMGRK